MTKERKLQDVSKPRTVETTLHLNKRLHGIGMKTVARRAVGEVRKAAVSLMRTKDVRIDPALNHFLWHRGLKNPPMRVRVRLERKVKEDDEEATSFYTVVTHVPVETFRGLKTEDVEADAE